MGSKLIVISAVNLIEGGTLTILRDCLSYLSGLASKGNYRIIAIVHDKRLANYPNIEYIELLWPKKNWMYRLWFEYITAKKISFKLGDVYLWLSLHDTSPNVLASRRAVYCHNPFPFYDWKWREVFLTPKIVLFSLFSRFAYQINIHKNDYVIVQQRWIKEQFKTIFSLTDKSIIIASPNYPLGELPQKTYSDNKIRFIYAASPNSHKNFECIAEATRLLSKQVNTNFEVIITVRGNENSYARWLKKKYKNINQLVFKGFMTRETLFQYYANVDFLVFPSKAETWGLPITEFSKFNKPMLLANLSYARETAAGLRQVAFFDFNNPKELANMMGKLLHKDYTFLSDVPVQEASKSIIAPDWSALFSILLR